MATTPASRSSGAKPANRSPLHAVLAAVGALIAAAILAEILLRVLPIPGIGLEPFYYDETTGGKLYPGSALTYRDWEGEQIRRRINSWGFLDVEHDFAKPPGTVRVGFFGDSYTEARQVRIEDTFFRRIDRDLAGSTPAVETLAFGIAGRSTTQSWIECLNWMDRADLDWVVYVFCENDPGDHFAGVSHAEIAPMASLVGDSLVLDLSFRDKYRHKGSLPHRAFQFIKAHSLLVSTVTARLRLLQTHGVQIGRGEDLEPGEAIIMGPSSWPSDSLATEAWRVTAAVISHWKADVEADGKQFAILRVPRSIELEKPLSEQDAFAPRLYELCASLNIDLIDPTRQLIAGRRAGHKMYDDHFTPDGHAAVAKAFTDWWHETHLSEDQ